jgi:flagellar biosynthesis protein
MSLVPKEKAVALRYMPGEETAPLILAKGRGYLARRIIEVARENGIYVHPDPKLVEMLMDVDVSDEIPPVLYKAVAKVLAMVFRVNKRLGGA